MYSAETTRADHVTTRLGLDARDAVDNLGNAIQSLDSVPSMLKQLDRLIAVHGDSYAEQLAQDLRTKIGELAVKAEEVSQLPVDSVYASPDLRDHYLSQTLRSPESLHEVVHGDFSDCID